MGVRDVIIDILARDRTDDATRRTRRNMDDVARSERRARDEADGLDNAMRRVAKTMGKAAGRIAAVGAKVATAVGAVGPLTVGINAAAKGAAALATAGARLAPLAAFIPSLAGAFGLAAGTIKAIGPGLVEALKPVTEWFVDADGNAAELTVHLRKLAADGVDGLAKEFSRLSMPVIADGMARIAGAVNLVVVETGRWINTAEGQQLIRTITDATAGSMEALAPKVTAAAVAVGRLALRAGDPAITGMADLIGRILDKFTAWANSTSVDDIKGGLKDLAGYFSKVRQAASAIRDIGGWLADNAKKVQTFSTAASGLGLALALVTGQWWVAVIAGISAVITNWDKCKKVFSAAASWWSQTWTSITNNPQIQGLGAAIAAHFTRMVPIAQKAFAQFQTVILPKLVELKDTIVTQLIPAVTNFINAVSPLAQAFAEKILPVIVTVMGTIVDLIKAAVTVISGIINVISGVISGDWSTLWEGVKQIFGGAWEFIITALANAWTAIIGVIGAGIGAAIDAIKGVKDRIVGFFGDAGSWLTDAGKAIVQGLANSISDGWGMVSDAIGNLVGKAKNAIPDSIRGLFTGASGGWQPAAFAAAGFAGLQFAAIGGGGRTQAPTPIVNALTTVLLDGREIRASARTVVSDEFRRQSWRATAGRR